MFPIKSNRTGIPEPENSQDKFKPANKKRARFECVFSCEILNLQL